MKHDYHTLMTTRTLMFGFSLEICAAEALLAFDDFFGGDLERSRFLRGWYGLGITGRLLFHVGNLKKIG